MEPEGSLPHSQLPATCPYPEPARSSPYPHTPLPNIHLNIILPSTPLSPKWSLSFMFAHQNPLTKKIVYEDIKAGTRLIFKNFWTNCL
jgi:hypothetical protein